MTAKRGERVLGPYAQRNRYRVIEVAADGSRSSTFFDTEVKARRYKSLLEVALARPEPTFDEGLEPPPAAPAGQSWGYVYFFRRGCGPKARIKIGQSRDVGARLAHLDNTEEPLTLVAYMRCDDPLSTERSLHRRFAWCRLRREWFTASDELVAFMVELAPALGGA